MNECTQPNIIDNENDGLLKKIIRAPPKKQQKNINSNKVTKNETLADLSNNYRMRNRLRTFNQINIGEICLKEKSQKKSRIIFI